MNEPKGAEMAQARALTGHFAGETHADDVLVRAAIERPADFGLLYERYLPRIYRYLAARSASPEEAADLAQTVFVRAFHALPRYRPRKSPFAAWLFRIARNAATDAHRRRKATVSWDGLPDPPAPAEAGPAALAEQRERLEHLRSLLEAVTPDKRELLALRFAGGLTCREIATVTGRSESAVKKQLTRTIASLKESYRDELP
jgi:RNA polymerase sigma-70 factor (ECF subfamily)